MTDSLLTRPCQPGSQNLLDLMRRRINELFYGKGTKGVFNTVRKIKTLLALVASVWFVQAARAQQFELQLQTSGGSITSGAFQLSDGSSNYLKIWDSLGHLQADWYVTIPASGGSVQVPTPLTVSPTTQYYLQYGATWLPISFAPQPAVALPSAFRLAFDEEFNEGPAFNAASNRTVRSRGVALDRAYSLWGRFQ